MTHDDTFPSHVAINIWSQAWVPILMDVTMEHAQVLAAKPISSLVASKKLIMDPIRERIHEARKHEDAAFAELLGKPANLEALQAFAEKRIPDYSGLGE